MLVIRAKMGIMLNLNKTNGFSGDRHIAASNETILLVIKFKIGGSLRFLSHAQMLRVFQRACVRAGISVQYSQGFNPHPRLSLPLPRPVGVESDDELLCLRVHKGTSAQEHKNISAQEHKGTSAQEHKGTSAQEHKGTSAQEHKSTGAQEYKSISAQLPEGCELLSITAAEANTSFQPCSATYIFAVKKDYLNDSLRATIKRLLASESIDIQRRIDAKNSKLETQNSKLKNVRDFLKSIELDDRGIIVECEISTAGSIRIEEILKLLELDAEKLAGPIRRTNVKWRVGES